LQTVWKRKKAASKKKIIQDQHLCKPDMGMALAGSAPQKTVNLYYAQEIKKAKKIYITTTIKANFSMQKKYETTMNECIRAKKKPR